VHWDSDELEAKPRARMNERAAVVANKHFRIGGRWKDEIALGMSIVGALWPAAYHYYVLMPKEQRRAREKEKIGPTAGAEKKTS
jgi:hypothetical protein